MVMQKLQTRDRSATAWNMTPVIDIVFLLIIFFMLVCQFIVAENFAVQVPDEITAAQPFAEQRPQSTTVTLMLDEQDDYHFAVGAERIEAEDYTKLPAEIAARIDRQLSQLPEAKRIVTLRIDKSAPYSQYQYALAGVSLSSATDIKLSVLPEKERTRD